MHRNDTNEPLLYIEQPLFEKPKAYMQMEYISTKNPEKEKMDETGKEDEAGSFKDLSIAGKINYLVNLPKEAVRMKCEVETATKSYRGLISEHRNGKIKIRIFGRESMWIETDKIVDIRLIGL